MSSNADRIRIVTRNPLNAEVAVSAFAVHITPVESFFVRCHFNVPKASAVRAIEVGGAVRTSFRLDPAELTAQRPEVTIDVTMECAGNSRNGFDPQPPGTPWGDGAVSTARFAGVRLAAILDRAGVQDDACEILFEGADTGETRAGEKEPYRRSLSLEVARHPDTLLAWKMNGAPLTPNHGAPVRLVVPGWYGMASVKWLKRITAITEPYGGFFQRDDYVLRGIPGIEDGTPVDRVAVNSRILVPVDGAVVPAGGLAIEGVAWSGHSAIAAVEVSLDDGKTWLPATLDEEPEGVSGGAVGAGPSPYAWRRWRLACALAPGERTLAVRARDRSGQEQPTQAVWNELGYVQNSIRRTRIKAE